MTPAGAASTQPGQGRGLTRLGTWFVVAGVTLITLGLLRDGVWLYLVALLLFASVTASWLSAPRLERIHLSVRRPTLEAAGGPTTFTLSFRGDRTVLPHRIVVTPEGADPVVLLHVGSEAAGSVSCDVEVRGARRGVFRLMRVAATATTPFGLVRIRHVVDVSVPRTVVPVPIQGAIGPTQAREGLGSSSSLYRLSRSGDDLHGVRPWNAGDGAAVHWRSTLRRGTPMVVERETPLRRSLVVLLGADPASPGFETLVAQVAGALLGARGDGASVHLLVEGSTYEATYASSTELLTRLAALPDTLATPSGATIGAALDLAGEGGLLVVAHTRPDPWVAAVSAAAGPAGVDVAHLSVSADAPRPDRPPQVRSESAGRTVRAAAALSALTGMTALALSGLVPPAGALVCVVALLGTAALAGRGGVWDRWRALRQLASAATVVVAFVAGAAQWNADEQFAALATTLSLLAVAHGFVQDTRRDVLVGLGLGPLMVLAAAGLAPGPALALPAIATWVAVLIGLTSAAAESDADGASAAAVPDLPPGSAPSRHVRWRPLLVTGVVAGAVVAFLLLPMGAAPMVRQSLLAGASGGGPLDDAPTTLDFFSGNLDLSARGPLSDIPQVQVRSGGPVLWRGSVLDTPEGGRWSATRPAGSTLTPGPDGEIRVPADTADSGAPAAEQREFDVRPLEGLNLLLLSPGAPTSVRGVDTVEPLAPGSAAVWNRDPWATYTVTAATMPDVDAGVVERDGPDRTEAIWVTPDPATTARTVELARTITAGHSERGAQVRAVEAWLRSNAGYRLDAPRAPAGQDPVDYFLFDSREGFCQHFAAAEATLLRAVGVPARLAVGFAVTPSSEDRDGWSIARGTDAHAWVEVWIPGSGWVSSDPTAGTQRIDGAPRTVPERIAAVFTSLWSTDTSRRLLALAVATIVALVVAVAALRRRRLRSIPTDPADSLLGRTIEPIAAFIRLRTALGHDVELGPADGVDEVRRHAADRPDVLAALDVVQQCLYDRSPVATDRRLHATDVLDRFTAVVLAESTELVPS